MPNRRNLNKNYSTTQNITLKKPQALKDPGNTFQSLLALPTGDAVRCEGGLRTRSYFKTSFNNKPLISIITVVHNGEKYLEKTIQSVLAQSYNNIEYIIIDGGSTDGTLDVIKKYEFGIDYWVSEKDAGIYDAMNKGLMLATGEVVGIINADDWYDSEAVDKSVRALKESGADYSVGNVKLIPSGLVAKSAFPFVKGHVYQGMFYPHITAFIRMNIYKKMGFFNTRYRIAADFDMAMRIHLYGYRAVYVDEILATVVEGGVSSDVASKKEYRMIAVAHGKSKPQAYRDYFIQRIKHKVAKILPKKIVAMIFRIKKSRFQYNGV